MRFLCVCFTTLSILLAVRCNVFAPEPMITAMNILRGVLASDQEWQVILNQAIKPEVLDSDGMLTNLGMATTPETKITPYQIVKWLVTHKGATGSQIMYGVRILGLALENRFAKSLSAHSLLALKFATNMDSTPSSVRHCISSIQESLVVFANKVAYFGHPIDFFWELNNLTNEFLTTNEILLDDEDEMLMSTRVIIEHFLETFLANTKTKIASRELEMKNEEILEILNLKDDVSSMNGHQQFAMINNIDYYEQVNVSSFGLDFGKKMFKVIKYLEKTTQENTDES